MQLTSSRIYSESYGDRFKGLSSVDVSYSIGYVIVGLTYDKELISDIPHNKCEALK